MKNDSSAEPHPTLLREIGIPSTTPARPPTDTEAVRAQHDRVAHSTMLGSHMLRRSSWPPGLFDLAPPIW